MIVLTCNIWSPTYWLIFTGPRVESAAPLFVSEAVKDQTPNVVELIVTIRLMPEFQDQNREKGSQYERKSPIVQHKAFILVHVACTTNSH